ncbi:GGDEF domain-containing protein [Thermomonas brevis]
MLVLALLQLPAQAQVPARPVEAGAVAFDALFRRMVGPASLHATETGYEADLERLHALLPAGDRAREVRLRSLQCASGNFDPAPGLAYAEDTLRLARAAGDVAAQARAHLCRAYRMMDNHGSQNGLADMDRAIALAERAGEPLLLAEAVEIRGDTRSLLGEQANAMIDYQRARAIYRDAGIGQDPDALRMGMAIAYRRMGDWTQARQLFTRGLASMRDSGDPSGEATYLIQLGFLHGETGEPGAALARAGRHADAETRYAQALPLIEREGNDRYLALLHESRAASAEALGRPAQALAEYRRHMALQLQLQRGMHIQQHRLLEHEYIARQRELENRRLRADAKTRREQLHALERVRNWQAAALALGLLLSAVLAAVAMRGWSRSRRMRALAMVDPLTGTASRHAIDECLDAAVDSAAQAGTPAALLMLDLDHFKAINDRYGHAAGDAVLAAVARAWQAHVRADDLLGRMGGEEFVVVGRGATLAQARVLAERLREATAALRLPEIDPELRVTVSIGIAEVVAGDTRMALIQRADAALYRAKRGGRDRVET